MSEQKIDGYMTDTQGRLVPIEPVSDLDKLRDQTVHGITAGALAMWRQLAAFKKKIGSGPISYIELSYERYGKKPGGKRGMLRSPVLKGSTGLFRRLTRYCILTGAY
jgi:hypothetical protein